MKKNYEKYSVLFICFLSDIINGSDEDGNWSPFA